MKSYKKLISTLTSATVAVVAALSLGLAGGNASALACYQYNSSGNFTTSTTPIFNNICNISGTEGSLGSTSGEYPLGDEPNFVRIRPETSSNPLGSDNPPLQNNLTTTCTNGSQFEIWTYIHNNAESEYNDNGSGSAVAHNVQLALSAPDVNQNGSHFDFSSTISASDATNANGTNSISDSTFLDCNGQQVKLTLVPNSVYYNNNLNQTSYNSLPDSDVNSAFPVGSPVWPSAGQSGTEWGCWNYRIVVVYTVEVQVVQPPSVTATCNLLSVQPAEDRKVTINNFNYTANNASFRNVVINWGDGSAPTTITNPSSVIGQAYQYKADGTYNITAVVSFTTANGIVTSGGSGTPCIQQVAYSTSGTPSHPTPTPTPTPPSQLVNTGPGSVVGIFAGVTAVSAVAYRYFIARRLSRQ